MECLNRHLPFTEYPNPLPKKFIPLSFPKEFQNIRSKIISTIFGQAVGDAVGLSTEFLSKEQAELIYKNERITFSCYLKDTHRSKWMNMDWKCVDWTDDTDQSLLILDSLVANNGNCVPEDFAARCLYWYNFGFSEVGDIKPSDVGIHTRSVLSSKNFNKTPIKNSMEVWGKGGRRASNGSVMRTSIAAIPYFWDIEKVEETTNTFGKVTHYDPRCQASVSIIVNLIGEFLRGECDCQKAINFARERGRKYIENNKEFYSDFDKFTNPQSLEQLELNKLIGYTYKPVGCAVWGVREAQIMKNDGKGDKEIIESVLMAVTYEAGDADTNAAVVGAVLGAYIGNLDMFPKDWIEFDHKNWLIERINRMLKLMNLEEIKDGEI
ncbi:hypothetical protein EIN_359140 [Entamoeba invadens IP1]|uniref:ADP-ribosylglycohydrolase n=1 Tax=Entamoeba invadens IP1 TaxID=370355 RepID=A0A0A1UB59_ENTIV|nr:hypothetical protein EIN_359140 [Entamoeba invadens IP1]ELP90831.1 hypothetical protein EIN_359140 [Entamoeba invadens IP1]|eukprot:XP_004257602.1 hypothetical protein EIN_359140 [Entamoeba invadens IP1]